MLCFHRLSTLALAGFVMAVATASAQEKEQNRLQEAGTVLQEIVAMPEGLSKNLLDKAECVVVLPSVKKLALGLGLGYGRGAMSCRSGDSFTGPWSAPVLMAVEAGSVGWQIGGQATDYVLLFMNPRAAKAVLSNKIKLGVDASAAAGPKGRDASADTDLSLRAEILTYSRARGLFAGVSLEGSTLRADGSANEKLYGRRISARRFVQQPGPGPVAAGALLVATLNKTSPKNESDPASLKSAPSR